MKNPENSGYTQDQPTEPRRIHNLKKFCIIVAASAAAALIGQWKPSSKKETDPQKKQPTEETLNK